MPRAWHRVAAVLVAAMASAAGAAPFDRDVALRPGGAPVFERFPARARLHVDRPEVVRAELLESGEVLLEAGQPGEAVLFLQGDGAIQAWRVRVGVEADPAATEAARARVRAACASVGEEGGRTVVEVGDAACVEATRALSALVPAQSLVVRFTGKGLVAQLADQKEALAAQGLEGAGPELAYVGAVLRLSGLVERPALDRAVRALWKAAASPLILDVTRLEVVPGKPEPEAQKTPEPEVEILRDYAPGTFDE